VEDAKLLADIYLKELEDCIMSKTRHDSFSGESYDITSLNYPRSKIILYNFAERYHQSRMEEKKDTSRFENRSPEFTHVNK